MGSEASIRRDETSGPRDRVDRLLLAFDALADGVWLLEAERDALGTIHDFRVVLVNRRAAEPTGTSTEDAVGRLLSDVAPLAAELGHIARYAEVVGTGEPLEFEFEYETGAGPSWHWVTASPLGGGSS